MTCPSTSSRASWWRSSAGRAPGRPRSSTSSAASTGPTAGRCWSAGRDVTALDEDGLDALRRDVVAFIFQTFGLVNDLTAAENVGLPLRLRRLPVADARAARRAAAGPRAVSAATREHRPEEMSGGQMQRVAIARALAGSPRAADRRRADRPARHRHRASR